jgi:hypothetical protein
MEGVQTLKLLLLLLLFQARETGCMAEYVKAICAKQANVDKFGAGL